MHRDLFRPLVLLAVVRLLSVAVIGGCRPPPLSAGSLGRPGTGCFGTPWLTSQLAPGRPVVHVHR